MWISHKSSAARFILNLLVRWYSAMRLVSNSLIKIHQCDARAQKAWIFTYFCYFNYFWYDEKCSYFVHIALLSYSKSFFIYFSYDLTESLLIEKNLFSCLCIDMNKLFAFSLLKKAYSHEISVKKLKIFDWSDKRERKLFYSENQPTKFMNLSVDANKLLHNPNKI